MDFGVEELFDEDIERRGRVVRSVLFAAQATVRWFYSDQHRQAPRLQLPLKLHVAADIGLGLVWLRYEGDELIATAEWWPWRDVEHAHLHAQTMLADDGSVVDTLRLTIERPMIDLEETGPAGIALSNFAGEVLRSINGLGPRSKDEKAHPHE